MNSYNSYLPFAFRQAPFQRESQSLMGLNDLLRAQLASLAVTSSIPLNGKRQFNSQADDRLSVFGFPPADTYKKLRLNGDLPVMHVNRDDVPIQKTNVKSRQPEKKLHKSHQNIVVLDEEEDCLIIDNPTVNMNNTHIYEALLPRLDKDFESIAVKGSQVIVIDDEDEDRLTCESTPQMKYDGTSSGSETPKQQKDEEVVADSSVDQYAKIPSLDLTPKTQQTRITRKAKLVWNPECCEPEVFESWTERISKAVCVEITSQEKILKTMKNFDMNIDLAVERVRRNKAHYKDYFKIKSSMKNKY